jgi:hypothetical protein
LSPVKREKGEVVGRVGKSADALVSEIHDVDAEFSSPYTIYEITAVVGVARQA